MPEFHCLAHCWPLCNSNNTRLWSGNGATVLGGGGVGQADADAVDAAVGAGQDFEA